MGRNLSDCVDITMMLQEETTTESIFPVIDEEVFEETSLWGLRLWQVLLVFISGFLSVVICLCCCIRFRIPRTKQEIEADFIRRKLTRKFKKQLQLIQNSEMDEMDLKKALERLRAEFKSESESIAQSDGLTADAVNSVQEQLISSQDFNSHKNSNETIGPDIESCSKQNTSRGRLSRLMGAMRFLRPRLHTAKDLSI